jgi:arylsulfatase A-like enzyme
MRRLLALSVVLLIGPLFGCAADRYPMLSTSDPVPKAQLAPAAGPARAEKVIIISIDGLRADAIEAAGAENLRKLVDRGAWALHAETILPSVTLPSHVAMLTGLDFKRHGVVWNNYRPGYILVPTVFSVAAQSNKQSAMLFSKDKFHFLANPACVGWIYGPPIPTKIPEREDYLDPRMTEKMIKRDEEFEKRPPPAKPILSRPGDLMTSAEMLGRAFAESYALGKWPVTFIHFREADENGHRFGWLGPQYVQGVKEVDKAIGAIVATIEKNGGFEKIALIITADHGGSARGHYKVQDPDRPDNVTIPWICVGPKVPAGLKIERPIHTFDTMPTALAFLGLGAPEGIDGRPVVEVLR